MTLIVSDPYALPDTPDGRAMLEERVGTDPLDALHAARQALIDELAPLRTLYGPGGLYDDKRKQLLELCKVDARKRLTEGGAKTTEAAIDAAAYTDKRYEDLLSDAEMQRIEWVRLENRCTDIEDRIHSRGLEITAYSREAGLR